MDLQILSYVFSILSLILYSIVYFPQFLIIYKTKKVDGISIWMLLLWGQADILSLIGTILLALELNVIIMGWYHIFIGFCMTWYVLYYDFANCVSSEKYKKLSYVSLYYFINLTASILIHSTNLHHAELGFIMGWFTSILYILGRFPQIVLNFKTRSTEGLSQLMYVFTIGGNLFYTLSVVTLSQEYDYIMINLPWIFMTIITIFLDLFVIYQCKHYTRLRLLQQEIIASNDNISNIYI